MPKEQVLGYKPAPRLEEVDDEYCERMQEREHVRDHAVILPDDANPKPDGIFGKDTPQLAIHQNALQLRLNTLYPSASDG